MMRVLAWVLVIFGAVGVAAQPRLEFEKMVHDFGEVNESEGPVEYSFIFRNIGNEPLVLNSVKASCGCTSTFWTNEPIAPGEAGKVTASYNPFNRPGPFNKSLMIVSNAAGGVVNLTIKGQVKPRVRSIEDHLPIKNGALRMKNRAFIFGRITTEKVVVKDFEVYNDSDSLVIFSAEKMEAPEHMEVTFIPARLESKTKGVIRIAYDPVKKNALGYQTDKVKLVANGAGEVKMFDLNVTIEEYFAPMTEEELANAPKLKLARASYDLGKITAGSTIQTEVTVANEGKEDLMIRETQSNCDCVVATVVKDVLKPGETTKIKVAFDTSNRKGKQFKTVTIFSNDPVNPVQMVMIRADM